MAFLPYNCSAYQVFIKSEDAQSDLGALDSLGYQTAAIHPVSVHLVEPHERLPLRSALKRSIIEDDFAGVTRASVYAIISATVQATRRFSSCTRASRRENTPLFVFNVTMQNHGGYDWDGEGYGLRQAYLPHR